MAECLSNNFNECSLAAVIERVNSIDVLKEPLLVKVDDNGRHLVHQTTGILDFDRKGDNVVSYSAEKFKEEFGDKSMMTYGQYVQDQSTLSDNRLDPLIDEVTRSQFMYMADRIEEIKLDMKDAGESFVPKPRDMDGMNFQGMNGG